MIKWPPAPSVLAPDPKALAALASAMVRTLAEAQAQLTQLRRRGDQVRGILGEGRGGASDDTEHTEG
jgi:hypothetical protein